MHLTLEALGWSDFFASQLAPDDAKLTPARVVAEHKNSAVIRTPTAELVATVAGKIFHHAKSRLDLPNVGDFVLCRLQLAEHKASIHKILPRRTVLARYDAPASDYQVLAANVDYAFIATSLNENFNRGGLRRIERFLALSHAAQVTPVVLLTKSDLVDTADAQAAIDQVRTIAPAVAIHAVSCLNQTGLEQVQQYLTAGKTAVVLGSSGVGKSTLVNYLAQADIQDMMEIRAFDDKGRHCTTSRTLIHLPAPFGVQPLGCATAPTPVDPVTVGGMIIDTPGLRGLTIAEGAGGEGLAGTFEDLDQLAVTCKFTNCRHATEPGCALRAALPAGPLDESRLAAYLKLSQEADALQRKANAVAISKQRKALKRQELDLRRRLEDKRRW